jgi:hypothetical protein
LLQFKQGDGTEYFLVKNSCLNPTFAPQFTPAMDIKELQGLATQVRRDIVRMVHAVQSGHPGG